MSIPVPVLRPPAGEPVRSAFPKLDVSDSALRGRTFRRVVVVADRFAQFSRNDRVLTLSELRAMVATASDLPAGFEWVVHPGLGVEPADLEFLEPACDDASPMVRLDDSGRFPAPVPAALVHKHRQENVLLAGIETPTDRFCTAELRVHRDNELVLDHHTGEHVQGIVIIEAIRQIGLAQFETSYRPQLPGDYAGVWKRLDLSFDNFLFPLRAIVEFEITEADLSREANLKFRATSRVRQNGTVVAEARVEYSMIRQERIDALEHRSARNAVEAHLA